MQFPHPLTEATFAERLNRFAVSAEVAGKIVTAHLPNSGRLTELLVPGARALLACRPGEGRRTPYDLVLIQYEEVWVSVDARLPNHLFREAVQEGILDDWRGHEIARAEVRYGGSRLDFLLRPDVVEAPPVWVEVKSATLVQRGCGLFPDAVTARGTRHLEELASAVRRGHRAAVVFVIQREDVSSFRAHWEADPAFSAKLAQVAEEGVEVHAYRCRVTPREARITQPVPVAVLSP